MENNYSLGNLSISLASDVTKTITDLDNVAKSLQSVNKVLKKIEKVNLSGVSANLKEIANIKFPNLEGTFDPIERLNTKAISKSTKALKTLSEIKVDDTVVENFKKLYNALDPLLSKIEAAAPALENFSGAIKVINEEEKKSNKKQSKGLFGGFNFGKIYSFVNNTKQLARSIEKMVEDAVQFEETLNKFQVSMGEFYKESLVFVDSLTNAFNLSTESIMNYQSTFNNMLTALGGMSKRTAYDLSETLTRMAIDYASLFNVEIDRAMQQFQGVLSGQIRQIRSVAGYDVSEASIFSIYESLGGTKSMRQLDETEKRLLRIIALQRQMGETGALGDFANTINSTSNQIKQLKDTLEEIGRYIGTLMLKWVHPLVQTLLAGAIAFREILKTIVNVDLTDSTVGSLFGDLEYGAESAEEAVESLQSTLLGFDKLNTLGSSSSSLIEADYSLLTNEIGKYKESLSSVSNKANDLATNILKSLGYTKEGNKWLKETESTFNSILNVVGGIISSIAASKIFEGVILVVGKLGGSLKVLESLINPLTIILGIFSALLIYNEDFRESFGNLLMSLSELLVPTLDLITSYIKLMQPLIDLMMDKLADDLIFVMDYLSKGIKFVAALLTKVAEYVTDFVENFSWQEFGEKLIKVFKEVARSIGNVGIKIINGIITGFSQAVNGIVNIINDITSGASELWTWIGIPAIPRIPYWNPKTIPELANGGVLTSPTMAMVGEYAGANTNPEIVTPENLMREVFVESMFPIAQAIMNGDREVIEAIDGLANRPINLNGRRVSENIYNDLQQVAIRKGKIMFAK